MRGGLDKSWCRYNTGQESLQLLRGIVNKRGGKFTIYFLTEKLGYMERTVWYQFCKI